MTKRTRSGILYALVLVFFVLGAVAVFYAQGWRVKLGAKDGRLFAVSKVGGLYLKVLPEDARITLDDKPIKLSPGIFERSKLLGGLFPQPYTVRVEREGFHDWAATLPVTASRVTSRAHIVLAPAKGEVATTTPVKAFKAFDDEIYMVMASGSIYHADQLLPGDAILAGADSGEKVLTKNLKDGSLFLYDLGTATSTNLKSIFSRTSLTVLSSSTEISFLPESENLFLAKTASSLRLADLITGRVTILEDSSKSIAALTATPARIGWSNYDPAQNRSSLLLYDVLSGAFIDDVDRFPGKTVAMEFVDRGTILMLQDDGSLYSLSLDGRSRSLLAEEALAFAISPDRNSVAVLDKSGLSVISDGRGSRYTFLRIADPSKVKAIGWYKDLRHLFLTYSDNIVFLDLEDATLANATAILPSNSFAYVLKQNDAYGIYEGVLTRLQFPD